MDELTQYLFKNYSSLLTLKEHIVWQYFILKAKGRNDTVDRLQGIYNNYNIATLINCDENEFYNSVKNRILKEHSVNIFLNYCPKCGNLTRTPRAKQCLRCKYDWNSI